MALNQLKHHMTKSGAPKPYFFGIFKHKCYDLAEIEAWQPNLQPQKRRKNKP